MIGSAMEQSTALNEKIPMVAFFLRPSPFAAAFIEDEAASSTATWDEQACLMVLEGGEPLWAALSKRPPTTCGTPGKTRPAGYNKAGKYVPAKWIPAKTDKRAGK
jgi:hypothetical protein